MIHFVFYYVTISLNNVQLQVEYVYDPTSQMNSLTSFCNYVKSRTDIPPVDLHILYTM